MGADMFGSEGLYIWSIDLLGFTCMANGLLHTSITLTEIHLTTAYQTCESPPQLRISTIEERNLIDVGVRAHRNI